MISIIVPVYKVEPYLRQCVDSILNQTYRNIEVLLIDDGSPDKCGEICDEYARKDNRVRVFHTENQGLSAARNIGISEAKGKYIGFVDSDDWIEPDMYEVLLKRMQETGADISECAVRTGFNVLNAQQQTVFKNQEILVALIDQRIANCVWNKLYQKGLFDGIAFPEGCNYEDVSRMHYIMGRAQRVVEIPIPKYHYQKRKESITKVYTAHNLIDYADAHMDRFHYFRETQSVLFSERMEDILFIAAKGISRVWRWWYGCSADEKQGYKNEIKVFRDFTRDYFPLFGCSSWPCYLRLSAFFMRSSCSVVFLLMYWMNQVFRAIRPDRANG